MSTYGPDNRLAISHHNDAAQQPILASGPWLRAGFVALSVEAVALIMLATGEAAPWIAIAIAIVAGGYARWAWHRARAALNAEKATTS
ncbi:MAG TPA: hypothetical protein VFJ48_00635 [Casimicrobiaceae bacterium]|nr:hypothetical protein [Casimicrobiaceae bacterium]